MKENRSVLVGKIFFLLPLKELTKKVVRFPYFRHEESASKRKRRGEEIRGAVWVVSPEPHRLFFASRYSCWEFILENRRGADKKERDGKNNFPQVE